MNIVGVICFGLATILADIIVFDAASRKSEIGVFVGLVCGQMAVLGFTFSLIIHRIV